MSRLIEVDKMLLAVIEGKRFVFRHEDMKNDEVVIQTVYKDLAEFVESLPSTTEEEIKAKAIDEFTEKAMRKLTELELKNTCYTVADCKIILRDVAEQLKGE